MLPRSVSEQMDSCMYLECVRRHDQDAVTCCYNCASDIRVIVIVVLKRLGWYRCGGQKVSPAYIMK